MTPGCRIRTTLAFGPEVLAWVRKGNEFKAKGPNIVRRRKSRLESPFSPIYLPPIILTIILSLDIGRMEIQKAKSRLNN
jgi:hypothetical protein